MSGTGWGKEGRRSHRPGAEGLGTGPWRDSEPEKTPRTVLLRFGAEREGATSQDRLGLGPRRTDVHRRRNSAALLPGSRPTAPTELGLSSVSPTTALRAQPGPAMRRPGQPRLSGAQGPGFGLSRGIEGRGHGARRRMCPRTSTRTLVPRARSRGPPALVSTAQDSTFRLHPSSPPCPAPCSSVPCLPGWSR